MDYNASHRLQQFKNFVGIKFQLYNSLFTSLPFHRIERTGILLSLLLEIATEGYKGGKSPIEIIDSFFTKHTNYATDKERADRLFRLIQYVERQVVLFDAVEDAAFTEVNDVHGAGTLKHLESEIVESGAEERLAEKLKEFAVRLVLTAHPTQFYPGSVLAIIDDLSRALKENNAERVNMYLQQLGKTPFLNKQKPTPYDEALSLLWFLENIFYPTAGRIITSIKNRCYMDSERPVLNMGFWPGGDRDGNPTVTTEITLKVAKSLREGIIKCYYADVRRLKRRLTFKGVDTILADLEKQLYNNLFVPEQLTEISKQNILEVLHRVKDIVVNEHNGLFLSLVDNLINKVNVFGLHFASLDIRQESSVHNSVLTAIAEKEGILPANYGELSDEEKTLALEKISAVADPEKYEDVLIKDTLKSVAAVKIIHQLNGVEGCHRYIISQCNSALNVLEVYALFLLGGWKKEELVIEIVPLFETIDDLKNANAIMKSLYENEIYKEHLLRIGKRQTIMVGFSDGTKDGGYLMANWSIYKAKKELTAISKEYGIDVVFFDGRGGPPGRGGGKSHKFYASMGKEISNKEIQITIQGQTISSSFGNIDSAQYNIEQLLNAGLGSQLFMQKDKTLNEKEELLMAEIANTSLQSYLALKNHPEFINYLADVSPLKFFSDTNIGSRPAKRGTSNKLSIKDLRAIPFVGSWSQIKQNITGYYGVGTALKMLDEKGRFNELQELYKASLFFKTLIDNCEMSMLKCFFPLTAFLSGHSQFSEIWNKIHDEYLLTEQYLYKLTGKSELMEDYPVEKLSIEMREKIVLPLITIQQYAMARIRELNGHGSEEEIDIYRKLVVRSSFGIISAGRNSA